MLLRSLPQKSRSRARQDCSDGCIAPYRSAALDQDSKGNKRWIIRSQDCPRIRVVDEHHPMTNERLILDCHTFADKCVNLRLDALTKFHALYLDKWTNLEVIAYLASIKIYEVVDLYSNSNFNIRGDSLSPSLIFWVHFSPPVNTTGDYSLLSSMLLLIILLIVTPT